MIKEITIVDGNITGNDQLKESPFWVQAAIAMRAVSQSQRRVFQRDVASGELTITMLTTHKDTALALMRYDRKEFQAVVKFIYRLMTESPQLLITTAESHDDLKPRTRIFTLIDGDDENHKIIQVQPA